jgi:hypothetical protein
LYNNNLHSISYEEKKIIIIANDGRHTINAKVPLILLALATESIVAMRKEKASEQFSLYLYFVLCTDQSKTRVFKLV